ncbi:MAG: DUF1223 domain-containing protein [Acidobacteria bacterium]|nr:DUF1223 domain-containing protein [Acidobacteriota bacterium]
MNLRITIFLAMCVAALLTASFYVRNPVSLAESAAWMEAAPTPANGEKTPVIVELFTSEGCSSCPPADGLLKQLEDKQPLVGVEIIALSEHVDYWNRLGWADPYSSALFSQRQSDYARAFGLNDIYTPQMVVDGSLEFVGSNATRAREALIKAASAAKASLTLASVKTSANEFSVTINVENMPQIKTGDSAEVWLAIAEGNLKSQVLRGENSGRQLAHTAVVRQLSTFGEWTAAPPIFKATQKITLEKNWRQENLKLVAFVQERLSRRILGAVAVKLNS